MLRASCLLLEINGLRCYEMKIRGKWKGRQLPRVKSRTPLSWATSALPLMALTAHTEWLPCRCATETFSSYHSTTHYYIVRVGGRPAVMAQWHGTGGSSQRCTTDGGCVTEVFRTTCAVHIYIADCEDLWLQSYVYSYSSVVACIYSS